MVSGNNNFLAKSIGYWWPAHLSKGEVFMKWLDELRNANEKGKDPGDVFWESRCPSASLSTYRCRFDSSWDSLPCATTKPLGSEKPSNLPEVTEQGRRTISNESVWLLIQRSLHPAACLHAPLQFQERVYPSSTVLTALTPTCLQLHPSFWASILTSTTAFAKTSTAE